MNLTQLQLNLRNPQARKDAGNAYEMHRTLTKAFQQDDKNMDPHPFLWRVELGDNSAPPVVLVSSCHQGDFDALTRTNGEYLVRPSQSIAVDLSKYTAGTNLRFRLVANPTKCTSTALGDGKRGKRYAIVGEKAQLEWLNKRAQQNGFEVQMAMVINIAQMHDIKEKSSSIIQLTRITFEGYLVVKDPELFGKALKKGIGRGKAFGCGMLTVS